MSEGMNDLKNHNNYMIEGMNNLKGHNDYMVEGMNTSKAYQDYITENLNNMKKLVFRLSLFVLIKSGRVNEFHINESNDRMKLFIINS